MPRLFSSRRSPCPHPPHSPRQAHWTVFGLRLTPLFALARFPGRLPAGLRVSAWLSALTALTASSLAAMENPAMTLCDLPPELMRKITEQLNVRDLTQARSVDRTLRAVAQQELKVRAGDQKARAELAGSDFPRYFRELLEHSLATLLDPETPEAEWMRVNSLVAPLLTQEPLSPAVLHTYLSFGARPTLLPLRSLVTPAAVARSSAQGDQEADDEPGNDPHQANDQGNVPHDIDPDLMLLQLVEWQGAHLGTPLGAQPGLLLIPPEAASRSRRKVQAIKALGRALMTHPEETQLQLFFLNPALEPDLAARYALLVAATQAEDGEIEQRALREQQIQVLLAMAATSDHAVQRRALGLLASDFPVRPQVRAAFEALFRHVSLQPQLVASVLRDLIAHRRQLIVLTFHAYLSTWASFSPDLLIKSLARKALDQLIPRPRSVLLQEAHAQLTSNDPHVWSLGAQVLLPEVGASDPLRHYFLSQLLSGRRTARQQIQIIKGLARAKDLDLQGRLEILQAFQAALAQTHPPSQAAGAASLSVSGARLGTQASLRSSDSSSDSDSSSANVLQRPPHPDHPRQENFQQVRQTLLRLSIEPAVLCSLQETLLLHTHPAFVLQHRILRSLEQTQLPSLNPHLDPGLDSEAREVRWHFHLERLVLETLELQNRPGVTGELLLQVWTHLVQQFRFGPLAKRRMAALQALDYLTRYAGHLGPLPGGGRAGAYFSDSLRAALIAALSDPRDPVETDPLARELISRTLERVAFNRVDPGTSGVRFEQAWEQNPKDRFWKLGGMRVVTLPMPIRFGFLLF